eukprot:21378-Rhodomonas_salina.1
MWAGRGLHACVLPAGASSRWERRAALRRPPCPLCLSSVAEVMMASGRRRCDSCELQVSLSPSCDQYPGRHACLSIRSPRRGSLLPVLA